MLLNKETKGGVIGTILSALGTGIQTNEVLQTISLIITITGSIITIAMAISNWWKQAKKDGKITKDEVKDGVDIIKDGAKTINSLINKKDKEGK